MPGRGHAAAGIARKPALALGSGMGCGASIRPAPPRVVCVRGHAGHAGRWQRGDTYGGVARPVGVGLFPGEEYPRAHGGHPAGDCPASRGHVCAAPGGPPAGVRDGAGVCPAAWVAPGRLRSRKVDGWAPGDAQGLVYGLEGHARMVGGERSP